MSEQNRQVPSVPLRRPKESSQNSDMGTGWDGRVHVESVTAWGYHYHHDWYKNHLQCNDVKFIMIFLHTSAFSLTRLDESTSWMRVCRPHPYLLHHWVIFFGGFPFPSQSCTQKSFNHLMMLQFHQSEKPWNKEYSHISFIPFPFVAGHHSIYWQERSLHVFTILAASISQTMCPFSKFELHLSTEKSGCDRREQGLESLPQAAPWYMVIGDFGMSDDFLVDKAPQHLDVSSLWASSTGIGQRFGGWRIENLSTHLAT